MTLVRGVLVVGRCNISDTMNIHYPFFYQYKAHGLHLHSGIVILLSYVIVNFHLFYNGADDM